MIRTTHTAGRAAMLAASFIAGIALATTALAADYGSMRNGTFDEPAVHKPTDSSVIDAKRAGWKLPADLVWPAHWGPNASTPNSSLEYLPQGGFKGSPAVRLGGGGHIASYFGPPEPGRPYIAVIRVRGEGDLWFGAYRYSAKGFVGGIPFIERKVRSKAWAEYRGLFLNDKPEVTSVNPALGATGAVEVDEVRLYPAEPVDVIIAKELVQLYGTGALVEDLTIEAVGADEVFVRRLAEYRRALEAFRGKAAALDRRLVESVDRKVREMAPYVESKQKTLVLAAAYNEMFALARALGRLTGLPVEPPGGVHPRAASPVVVDHKPGVRKPRPAAITVTDIRSNKVRYDENETARTVATIVNTSAAPYSGTLVARMRLDVDVVRDLAAAAMTIPAGQTRQWGFAYSVGPETYGRAIEVQVLDAQGRTLDAWQEYYAVATEWFRVQQHTYAGQNSLYEVSPWTTYFTQSHFFAGEPTDFGVQDTPAEVYLSGQAGYVVNQAARQAQIDHFRAMGVTHTFYQNFAFCGPMGYEEMRRHPEYVLYDENGQPAVDPIYGGYPNPMELAAQMEMGPKRKPAGPPLDRRYAPWQHCPANLALEEAIVYEAERVRRYAKAHGFDGVYIDGNLGVFKGYGYDGKPNVPSGKEEDFARLSARNHRLFSEIVKAGEPNFGTWYNWGRPGIDWARSAGLTALFGSGVPGDVSDENIRAATAWKNVMILWETGSFLHGQDGPTSRPDAFLQMLLDQRDYAVQRWGASTIIGYNFVPWREEEPGPARWAWPTVNYAGAQWIASQTHHAGGFLPSLRPTFQFMTRYSRLLWAPDIRVVADEEKIVEVASPEKLWWNRMVYRRQRSDGYDLIVHLVRIPPTPRWDYRWAEDPAPLAGVRVGLKLPAAAVQRIDACRPYHFDEPQQVVQTQLTPSTRPDRTEVDLPPFRYHTMVVCRIRAQ